MKITADVSYLDIATVLFIGAAVLLWWVGMLRMERRPRHEQGRPPLFRDPLTYVVALVSPFALSLAVGYAWIQYQAITYEVDTARVGAVRVTTYDSDTYSSDPGKCGKPLATHEIDASLAAAFFQALRGMEGYSQRPESPRGHMHVVEFTAKDTGELLPEYTTVQPVTSIRGDANIVIFRARRSFLPSGPELVASEHRSAEAVAELYRLIGVSPEGGKPPP